MDIGYNNQVLMHKGFFDKAIDALESGYYLEAVFLEYAAARQCERANQD